MTPNVLTPKILVVKLSSLGDVLHTLPIVWDLRARLPNAQIDWIVEEAYVPLLEPLKTTTTFQGIDRIIPLAFRRWRKELFKRSTWSEFWAMRHTLQASTYDVILETQGLIKSALVCALAKKAQHAIVAGLGNATEYSGYEPLARLGYTQSVQVPRQCHAIDRARLVMCAALDWQPLDRIGDPPRFYADTLIRALPALLIEGLRYDREGLPQPYVMCFHSTARHAKRWGDDHWVKLGQALAKQGYQLIFPWGNSNEKRISQSIARQVEGALVPRAISIAEAYQLIAHAALIVGVDTGLTHLAAALGKPTVEIYCDSPRWKTEGYWGMRIANTGDLRQPPSIDEVFQACLRVASPIA